MNYEIGYVGDMYIRNVHHIEISFNGNMYSVIFGYYANGGFFSIPNWECGGELAALSDVFWNKESIYRSLKDKKAAEAIAKAIRDYNEVLKEKENK